LQLVFLMSYILSVRRKLNYIKQNVYNYTNCLVDWNMSGRPRISVKPLLGKPATFELFMDGLKMYY
ncbi:MAG: hypothetical protein ACJ72S_01530, partial [Nitrososphaeraceae archaeon]